LLKNLDINYGFSGLKLSKFHFSVTKLEFADE